MDEWLNGSLDGWMEGWMDGEMDRRLCRSSEIGRSFVI